MEAFERIVNNLRSGDPGFDLISVQVEGWDEGTWLTFAGVLLDTRCPVRKICFTHCYDGVDPFGLEVVLNALRLLPNLEELIFKILPLRQRETQLVADFLLSDNQRLQALEIRQSTLNVETVFPLSESMKYNVSLRSVNFSFNQSIGCEAAEIIADAISTNQTIREVDLSHCSIRKKGLMRLAEACRFHSNLRLINVVGNLGTNVEVVKAFVDAENTTWGKLTTFAWMRNKTYYLREQEALQIAKTLEYNIHLVKLDMVLDCLHTCPERWIRYLKRNRQIRDNFIATSNQSEALMPFILSGESRVVMNFYCMRTRIDLIVRGLASRTRKSPCGHEQRKKE